MKQKLLLIGYRAYGDWIYTLPAINELLKVYDIHLEINIKGHELFHGDPRFTGITVCEFERYPEDQIERLIKERQERLIADLKPDRVLNINGTLEVQCIAERFQDEFHLPVIERQRIFGGRNFYEAVFERCGLPIPETMELEGLYFTPEQLEWADRWRERHKDQFVVIVPFAGSRCHKVYHEMPRLTREILERHPDAFIYLAGDAGLTKATWKHERIRHTCNTPIKQVILMTKQADMVIGGETGLMVAAGMWGTPKVMLCTASSIFQTTKYHKNDFSMQAKIGCSPCHRAIHTAEDCESMVYDDKGEALYPACVKRFDYDEILQKVDHVHEYLRRRIPSPVC